MATDETVVSVQKQITDWETVRYELLNQRIMDLGLKIEGSRVEPMAKRLVKELDMKGLRRFRPKFYLTDTWGCPDGVPAVGIPFYLADERLVRIEEEQTGSVEDDATVLMYLRHEVGHAINYAYALWKDADWKETFGEFHEAYRDRFQAAPASRDFVRHIFSAKYGQVYAQKHPDEDFAETFAVWLTPRSGWREKYKMWKAGRKLEFVDDLMKRIRGNKPVKTGGRLFRPADRLRTRLVKHYGLREDRFRAVAKGYVDDRLREVFAGAGRGKREEVAGLVRSQKELLGQSVARWARLEQVEARAIVRKVENRSVALKLTYLKRMREEVLMRLSALCTALGMEYSYTGRFMD